MPGSARGETRRPDRLSRRQGRPHPAGELHPGQRLHLFRTVKDGEIFRHALDSICAFEIDDTDEFLESGWSVVVVGRLQLATEDDFARMLHGEVPEPWAAGDRWMFVRLSGEDVSGRRVIGHGR